MVGMADATFDVDARVPAHDLPVPSLRLRVVGDDPFALRGCNPVRIAGANMDRLTPRPIAKFDPVRLAAIPPAERLVVEDQVLGNSEAGCGYEKPLPLTAIRRVLTTIPSRGPQPLPALSDPNFERLECLLRLPDGANRSGLGDGRDEPVPLVVTAKKLVFLSLLPNQDQQVPVGGLNIKNRDLGISVAGRNHLEELTIAVGLHIQRKDARPGSEPT